MSDKDTSNNYQLNQLLIAGIALICFGIFQLPTIWTFKSSLQPLHGTVRSADIYITTVTDRGGPWLLRSLNAIDPHESQVSELVLYLNEYSTKFSLMENIGDSYSNDEYRRIVTGLRKADSVTVWIKKSEADNYQPRIYQIDRDRQQTLLELETVRVSNRPLALFVFALGLGSIAIFLRLKYPERFKKFFA